MERYLEEEKQQVRQELRRNGELDKVRRLINFANDWKEKGEQNWRQNMKIKLERDRKDKAFQILQSRLMTDKKTMRIQNERTNMLNEIDEFENRYFSEKDTDTETVKSYEDFGQQMNRELIQRKFSIEASIKRPGLAQLLKARERELQSEGSRKEQDKRRRKMIVDQSKNQRQIDMERKQKMLLEKLI